MVRALAPPAFFSIGSGLGLFTGSNSGRGREFRCAPEFSEPQQRPKIPQARAPRVENLPAVPAKPL